MRRRLPLCHVVCVFSALLIAVSSGLAQTATIRGQVLDQTGAVVPQATIILTDSGGKTTTNLNTNDGSYMFSGLAPGNYKVQASAPNMAQKPVSIELKGGTVTLRLELK